MRRSLLLVVAIALALGLGPPVGAKDGAQAHLLAPLPAPQTHPPYSVLVRVPPGEIRAIRPGLHGSTDVFFPLVASAERPCRAGVRHDVLPIWMRAGFSGPRPRIPYVLGRRGLIGGVLFGWPLHSPPLPDRSNKILWVPRSYPKTPAPLWIRLQSMEGGHAVGAPIRKIISTGPGPSIVDVPSAGCWRLTFSWSGRRDTLDLEYTAPDT